MHFDRWYPDHKEEAAASYAAWYAGNKDHRAEYQRTYQQDRGKARYASGREQRAAYRKRYRQDPGVKKRELAATQAFKTDPANAERVREYNRRGRQRYMARADRPCLSPDECTEHARVGSKYCPEHQRIESSRHLARSTARRKEAMAEAQAWVCPWCQDYLPPSLARTHVDHIIPRASGLVIEDEWNLQLLHARCNQQKSEKITAQAVALAAGHGLTLATRRVDEYSFSC